MGAAYYFTSANPSLKVTLYFIVPLALLPLVTKWNNNARYQAKVNEQTGMMNDFNYVNLSKEERREFDKEHQMQMERLISSSELKKMTHKGPKHPEIEMELLTGLEPVKKKMEEVVARALFDRDRDKKALFMSHFVFFGGPGTGKTTVARIMTGLLYKAGCIKENKCVECDGNALRGAAPGEGAQKTELLIRTAWNGVLFIDEAYAMADSFGSEAIQTLIKQMEDQRGHFVLILAGYTQQINDMLDRNPGFRSRINEYIEFPDYSLEEAKEIFCRMAEDVYGMDVSDEALVLFEKQYLKAKTEKDFGNARTIRNILEKSISKHAVNLKILPKIDRYRLCRKDFV